MNINFKIMLKNQLINNIIYHNQCINKKGIKVIFSIEIQARNSIHESSIKINIDISYSIHKHSITLFFINSIGPLNIFHWPIKLSGKLRGVRI